LQGKESVELTVVGVVVILTTTQEIQHWPI